MTLRISKGVARDCSSVQGKERTSIDLACTMQSRQRDRRALHNQKEPNNGLSRCTEGTT
jgi:hypothetical protein